MLILNSCEKTHVWISYGPLLRGDGELKRMEEY